MTSKREDGFHELLSLVALLIFGDYINIEVIDGADHIISGAKDVPLDRRNLVMQAIEAFRKVHPYEGGVFCKLEKHIPVGAGLGGGSSDAMAMLEALNLYFGFPLSKETMSDMAASIGSDCPLFLEGQSCEIRGRGEKVSLLDQKTGDALRGRKLLLFMPDFSIETQWAYGELSRRADSFMSEEEAEQQLSMYKNYLVNGYGEGERCAFNSFQSVVYDKCPDLQNLSDDLMSELGVRMHLSGSGSACFCLLNDINLTVSCSSMIKKALGSNVFMIETFIK